MSKTNKCCECGGKKKDGPEVYSEEPKHFHEVNSIRLREDFINGLKEQNVENFKAQLFLSFTAKPSDVSGMYKYLFNQWEHVFVKPMIPRLAD